jgi:hypothetical protein
LNSLTTNFAPIVIFTYNRLDCTKSLIKSLLSNPESKNSNLIIFSDGPKKRYDYQNISKVRLYLKSIGGFKKIKIIKRTKNLGLKNNIIQGVSDIFKKYNEVIVLEDDLEVSKDFLKYMNHYLLKYKDNKKVFSIHAYNYPLIMGSILSKNFFLRGADCWGWAIWKDRWSKFIKNKNNNKKIHKSYFDILFFNYLFTYPYSKLLKYSDNNKINSWAIDFYAYAFIENLLTLYPSKSLIKNNGINKNGTHFKNKSKQFDVTLKKNNNFIETNIKHSILAFLLFSIYFFKMRLFNKYLKND